MNKIINLFSIVFICFSFFSCSSDDGSDENGIVGTWVLTSFSLENNYDFNGDGNAIGNILTETSCVQEDKLEFNADNTGTISNNSSVLGIDFEETSQDNYEYALTCEPISTSIAFNWEQDGDTITITTVFDSTILTLSQSQLTSIITDGYSVPVIINNDYTGYSTEDVTLVYTKQ